MPTFCNPQLHIISHQFWCLSRLYNFPIDLVTVPSSDHRQPRCPFHPSTLPYHHHDLLIRLCVSWNRSKQKWCSFAFIFHFEFVLTSFFALDICLTCRRHGILFEFCLIISHFIWVWYFDLSFGFRCRYHGSHYY